MEQGGAPDPLTELLATVSVFSHTQVLPGPGCRRTSFPLPGAEAPASGAGWGVVLCTLRGSLKAGPDPHTPPVKALGRTQAQSGLLDPDIPPGKAWGGRKCRVGSQALTHLQGRPWGGHEHRVGALTLTHLQRRPWGGRKHRAGSRALTHLQGRPWGGCTRRVGTLTSGWRMSPYSAVCFHPFSQWLLLHLLPIPGR